MSDMQGLRVLVTGAFSGLGLTFARHLATQGASVVMAGRRLALGREISSSLRGQGLDTHAVALDVTDPRGVGEAFEEAAQALGAAPDVLVNNAGVASTCPAISLSLDEWHHVISTNLTGCFLTSQAFAALLSARERPGVIVNIASILGLRQAQQVLPYAVAKAGLVQLTQSLALEWARHRIRVNALAPGYIATDLNADFFGSEAGQALVKRIPMRRLGSADELLPALELLVSPRSSFMTGSVLAVDGGHLINSL